MQANSFGFEDYVMKSVIPWVLVILVGLVVGISIGTQKAHHEAAINLYSSKLGEMRQEREFERYLMVRNAGMNTRVQAEAQAEAATRARKLMEAQARAQAEAAARARELMEAQARARENARLIIAAKENNRKLIAAVDVMFEEPRTFLRKIGRIEEAALAASSPGWAVRCTEMRKVLLRRIQVAEQAGRAFKDSVVLNDDGSPRFEAEISDRRKDDFLKAIRRVHDTVEAYRKEFAE